MQEETFDAHSKRLRSLSASVDSSFLGFHRCFQKKLCFQHTFSLYDPNMSREGNGTPDDDVHSSF
jgi:hypothetical protein